MSDFDISDIMAVLRKRDRYAPGVWPPKAWDPILSEIGRIVFNWNTAERTITRLLDVLLGGEHRAIIATAHLSNRSKTDAIKTLSREFLDGNEQSAVLHAVKLFEKLTIRRNHYVHSFSNIASDLSGTQQFGKLSSYHAKGGRLARKEQTVTAEDLADEAKLLHAANEYLARIHNHFRYPDNPTTKSSPKSFLYPMT